VCVCVCAVQFACVCMHLFLPPYFLSPLPLFALDTSLYSVPTLPPSSLLPSLPPSTLPSFFCSPFTFSSSPLSSILPYPPFTSTLPLHQSTDVTTGGYQEGQSDIPRPLSDGTQPSESVDQDPSLSPSRLYGRALQTPCRDLPGQEEGEGEGRDGEGMIRDVERDVQTSHGKPG
jgi:hypothetical protein